MAKIKTTNELVLEELAETFDHIDLDNDGLIELDDMRALLRNCSINLSNETMQHNISRVCPNDNSTFTLGDFTRTMVDCLNGEDGFELLHKSFNILDRDDDGKVDAVQLARLHNTLMRGNSQPHLTNEDASSILDCADLNADRAVTLEEFISIIMSGIKALN
ncbi:hypothetical protein Ciccas_006892 [Cichlidogyrus casuarinus]|uniref:EF-hand domain-containing protein n=1 Tax=Cichlidogyrus casuarinus TaxID=1844966 RepID=A0ABD2Q4F4_9PLAT